ncbi:MAG: hypothetical protein C5B59_01790, partial [Bacteroidetes bacterium]
MEPLFNIAGMLTAGSSLTAGMIYLLTGLQKDGEKVELIFGILSLSLFVYLMLPPVGFTVVDKAPYSNAIILKRVFIYAYYILLPWYIGLYSGYRKKNVSLAIGILLAINYCQMAFASMDSMKPVWLLVALIADTMILIYGIIAARWQIKNSEKSAGRWLMAAMIIYGSLLIPALINNLGDNFFAKWIGSKIFFPFHLHLLAFIVIMSIRLRERTSEKFRLEKELYSTDHRWSLLVRNMRLLLLELDNSGNLRRLNPYAISALAIENESDFLNKNWFDHFVPKSEIP